MKKFPRIFALAVLAVGSAAAVSASTQDKPAPDKPFDPVLTVERLFSSREFAAERFGPARWMTDGATYTTLEPSAEAKGGRDLVLYDAASGKRERSRLRGEARPARRRRPARHRGLRLVARRQGPHRLHQLEAGLAPEHPGRFLDLRAGHGPARAARPGFRGLDPDVRQALARRPEGRLRRQERHLRRGPGLGPGRPADLRRRPRPHQRHLRLGQRGGVRHPRRVPLEPGQRLDRLLAVRHDPRPGLHHDRQHERPLPGDDDLQAPQARPAELGRPRGRRRGGRRPGGLDEDARRSVRHVHRPARMGRQLPRSLPAAPQPPPEHAPCPCRRRGDGRGPDGLHRHRQDLGRGHGRFRLARRRPAPALAERARRLEPCLRRGPDRGRDEAPDPGGLRCPGRRGRRRKGRLALRHGLARGRDQALPLPRPHGWQGETGARRAGRAIRRSSLRHLALGPLGLPHVFAPRRAAGDRARPPAQGRDGPAARGQHGAPGQGRRAGPAKGRVLQARDRRRHRGRRLAHPAARFRSGQEVSPHRLCLRRAGRPDRPGRLGRQRLPLAPDAGPERLYRRQLRQPRHAGPPRPGLAQDRSTGRSASWPRPTRPRPCGRPWPPGRSPIPSGSASGAGAAAGR